MISHKAILGALCAAFAAHSAYVYTAGTAADRLEPMDAHARSGQQVFQDYNCIACHQLYGLGGYLGPDLTNVISNRGTAYARAFIRSGSATMPDLGVTEAETEALVAYLSFVSQTGTYPVEHYDIKWYGMVAQEDDPK